MAKKAKKRGVKPGTKRGKYKRNRLLTIKAIQHSLKAGDKVSIPNDEWRAMNEPPKYTPAPILTLCGQLEDSILLLENRINNAIAKINSLM